MLWKKKILLYTTVIFPAVTTISIVVGSRSNYAIGNKIAEQCPHNHVEKYDAVAPTLSSMGQMEHFACCDCHTAWEDSGLTKVIGNTISDRSKIDIYRKTNYSLIEKGSISNDDITLIRTDSPYVVGLDQTNWTATGKGSGSFEYAQIDDRKAVRISAETLSSTQVETLDGSNCGYSSWTFAKSLNGNISVSFDYKCYDLDRSQYLSEARTHVVFGGSKIIGCELNLISDNAWHSISFTSNQEMEFTDLTFKVHHFKGEIFISNLQIYVPTLEAVNIQKNNKSIEFRPVENADYYLVHDDNDNRSEIRLESSDVNAEGKLVYKPFVVGDHSIYVTAHDNDGKYVYSTSNVIDSISVDPVFMYDQFINEYYVPKDYAGDTSDLPSDYKTTFDDWGLYHARQTKDGALVGEDGDKRGFKDRLDLSTGDMLDSLISNAKEIGCNVLSLNDYGDGCLRVRNEEQWYNHFEYSSLKNIMDKAWENGLKVIVYDQTIHHNAFNEKDESKCRDIVYNRFLDADYSLPMIQHKAFYGLTIPDEPSIADIVHDAKVAKYCKDFFSEYYVSKSLSVKSPFVLTALLPYSKTIFGNIDTYKQYVKTWLDVSELDYVVFDEYTYRTASYDSGRSNTDELLDLQYNILEEIRSESEYSDFKIHQVTTSNNDKDIRSPFNVYDVFGSTLFTAAYNNFGNSKFTYFPAAFTYHWNNGIVNRDGSKKESYYWVKEANKQYGIINDLLDGFKVTKTYFDASGKYGDNDTIRTAKIKLSNGENNYFACINYDSNPSSIYKDSYVTTIPNGRIYYIFGPGIDTTKRIGTNNVVTIGLGNMVLVTDELATDRDLTLDASRIAGSFGMKGTSDLVGFDFSVQNNILNIVTTDGTNPLVWLNKESNGATTFLEVAKRSTSFTIRCKAEENTPYNYQLIEYIKPNDYIGHNPDINIASGGWDDVTFTGYKFNSDGFALTFFTGLGSIDKSLQIQNITFHGINGPLFVIEDFDYYDHRTLSDAFNSPSIVSNYSNNNFENNNSFVPSMQNSTRSYSFDFKVKLSNTNNSIFFFMEGNTGWSGIEFVFLNGSGQTQIYLPDSGDARTSFYSLEGNESLQKEYKMSFEVIRCYSSSNLYVSIKVDEVYWVQWVIKDSKEYGTSHIGFYNYASSLNNTIMYICDSN